MRVLYLANNWVGHEVLRWLTDQGEEIVGVVLHPPEKQRHGREMLETASLGEDRVFSGATFQEPENLHRIRDLKADVAISVFFGHILRDEILGMFPNGCLNLHPAYLPFNRGQYPNVWSIVEGTPAGATLHYMDVGIDTGAIVARKEVEVEPVDTGESLYRKLERASFELFKESWPAVKAGTAHTEDQDLTAGTYHRTRDVERIDAIDLNKSYKAKELIDILRARTFPPYRGAYFEADGSRIYIQLHLEAEEQSEGERRLS